MPQETGTAGTAVELDAEGRALQLEAEKAKLREAIATSDKAVADAKASVIASAVPDLSGAPTGTVTVGEKAGAFAAWLAHRALADAAGEIASRVQGELTGPAARVLVVEERYLAAGDWTFTQTDQRITRLQQRLTPLLGDIAHAAMDLSVAVAAWTKDEAVAAPGQRHAELQAEEVKAVDAPTGEADEVAATATAASPAGAFSAAVDLMGLLRTDYTLTSATVTANPAELATLTAGALARLGAGVAVELDGDVLVRESPLLGRFAGLLTTRDEIARPLAALDGLVAAVAADLTARTAQLATMGAAWTETAKAGAVAVSGLSQDIEQRLQRIARRERARGPAQATADAVRQVLADVDAAAAAMVQAPAGGPAELLMAATRERLGVAAAKKGITHVLYVHADELGADVVTRRSLLGTSGRLGFLGGATTSWLLLETESGTLTSGGASHPARWMIYDLATGESAVAAVSDQGTLGDDPLTKLEAWAKAGVGALIAVLLVVGVVGLIGLVT
jgi:hypothetical protein